MAKQKIPVPKTGVASVTFTSSAAVPSVVLTEDGSEAEYTFINLTSHRVNILDSQDDVIYCFPPSGKVARVALTDQLLTRFQMLDIFASEVVEIKDLPEPQPRTFFIVSHMVKQHAKDRNDLLTPHYSVKTYDNQVVGCRALQA